MSAGTFQIGHPGTTTVQPAKPFPREGRFEQRLHLEWDKVWQYTVGVIQSFAIRLLWQLSGGLLGERVDPEKLEDFQLVMRERKAGLIQIARDADQVLALRERKIERLEKENDLAREALSFRPPCPPVMGVPFVARIEDLARELDDLRRGLGVAVERIEKLENAPRGPLSPFPGVVLCGPPSRN